MVETRRMNLSLYLDVMGSLPGVTSSDVEAARQTLIRTFGDIPSSVTFERGVRHGDGDIVTQQDWTGDDGHVHHTTLHLLENGQFANYDTHFSASLPTSLARYFFAGIFGTDEMSSSMRSVDTNAILAGSWNPAFDPQQTPSVSYYAPELMEGARLLYSCAQDAGSLSACLTSDGGKIISAVKAKYEADSAAHDQAVRENQDRQRIAQEQAAQQQRQSQIDNYERDSERAWTDAEMLREASRGIAAGDPDDIQDIMNRYAIYRYYGGTSDDLENARMRYQKSLEMMRDIAYDDGGWPQFSERLCTSFGFLGDHCESGTAYTCKYGASRTIYFSHTCPHNDDPRMK